MACEAACAFSGGVFKVLIPDNTKAIVVDADPLAPRITPAFLEYAQARHFHLDPARVRSPRDKGRVERAVPGVRDDCFAGELLLTIEDARTRGHDWCLNDYGLRRHSRTQRRPLEHFQAEEQGVLLPAPLTPYDIPLWSDPKSGAISWPPSTRRSTRCRTRTSGNGSPPEPMHRSSASTREVC